MFFVLIASLVYGQRTYFISYEKNYLEIPLYQQKLKAFDSLKLKMSNDIEQRNKIVQEKLDRLLENYNPTKDDTIESIKKRMSKNDSNTLEVLENNNIENDMLANRYNSLLENSYKIEIQPLVDFVEMCISKFCRKKRF